MKVQPFNFSRLPELVFGSGKISTLSLRIKGFGSRALIVVGGKSFVSSIEGNKVLDQLKADSIDFKVCHVDREPTPQMIDDVVQRYAEQSLDVVVAIGGGSALDAGKAISAMLPLEESVKDYLEGVGTKNHPGKKLPFIAVPTTAGTGSEATKNAVLSETGASGFKKSLRHNNFVPEVAIIDPLLTISCPPPITASSGMDAFTQLLESYVSTAGNPMTDALALQGLELVSRSLRKAYSNGGDSDARGDMALASYLSGVTLANAGLGLVHGYASAIGGYYDISHGVICSALMPVVNEFTVRELRKQNDVASLTKFACAGRLFSRHSQKTDSYYIDSFVAMQYEWRQQMQIPSLGTFIKREDFQKIATDSDNKNNPVKLELSQRIEILDHV